MTEESTRRIALVTGASKDIGRAIAQNLSEVGYEILAHYLNDQAGASETLACLTGEGHRLLKADFSELSQVDDLVASLRDREIFPSVLVNNAGVAPRLQSQHDVGSSNEAWLAAWTSNLNINVLGAAYLTKQVAQLMIGNNVRGRIVFIGSRGAFKGEELFPAYAASKAAVHALSKSLAIDLGKAGIRVSCIAPGFIDTRRIRERGELERFRKESPFGRMGTPEEVAFAVRYLVSDEAEWSAGAVLDFNGASYFR